MFDIDISEILTRKGSSISFNVSDNVDVDNYKPEINKFLSPVKVEGTITNNEGNFKLTAKLDAKVSLSCYRCLKPVEYDISLDIDEVYTNNAGNDEEAETFVGNTIELSSIVRKSIIFSLPMKVVCSEGCKGLCPVCGKDLNDGPCSCDTSYINPKFESLRSLFKVDEEV